MTVSPMIPSEDHLLPTRASEPMHALSRVSHLIMAHKVRLVGFGFPWFERFCAEPGAEREAPFEAPPQSEADEMIDLGERELNRLLNQARSP